MKAVVVYESHYGNTAKVARAVAEGIGPGTPVLTTDEADAMALAGADLVVAGAPVMAFGLPRNSANAQLSHDTKAPVPADISHPMLRTWLDAMPAGNGWAAAFETRIWWTPRGATGTIESKLSRAGYQRLAKGERFVVSGGYGPLRSGEEERARAWGSELGKLAAAKVA